MARQPRFFVPGEVLHVIQCGNNREPLFAGEEDYRFFLDCLAQAIREHGVSVHAYVLITNHVHLLATPRQKASLPRALQSVRQLFRAQLSGVDVEAIREATNKNWALGNERFKQRSGRRPDRMRMGRPAKFHRPEVDSHL